MKKIHFAAFLLVAVSAACAGSSNEASLSSNTSATPVSYDSETASKGRLVGGGGGGGGGGREEPVQVTQQISLNQAETAQTAPTVVERKIIRNADLQLESDSPEDAQRKIAQIAESKRGFVVESSQTAGDVKNLTRDTVTMTVRVPSEKFDEAIDEIRKTGTRVVGETIKGRDVTEEFIDIEARLKAQKALEAQFVEIMKQAKTVEDALSVQSQLAEVRGEIEKVEGRKRFLENQASLSTLKIRLQAPAAVGASSSGFFYRLTDSLSSGFDFALSFLLGLITFAIAVLPFLLFVVLPIYLVLRYFWKKSRQRKTASEILQDEIKHEL